VIAAAVFGAAAVAYVWPALFGDKVVYPGLENRIQTDVIQDFVPWLQYARESIRSGELPTWNPFVLSGAPFYANPQTAVASPVNVPVWILPFGRGLALSYALKLWIGAMGAFALTRALGLRRIVPGLVAGLAYGFLPFTIIWLQWPQPNVWMMLPWMVWGGERIVQGGRLRDVAWLGVAAAVAFAGGHPESALHVSATTGLYALLRLLLLDLAWLERLRRLALVALGGVAGALVAAAVLLPVLHNFADSAYAQGRSRKGNFHLPLSTLRTVLFPDWWGRPTGVRLSDAAGNFQERTIYPGAVALIMATIGLVTTSWRRTIVWVVLGAIGISAAVGLPPVFQLLSNLPPFDRMANTRLIWIIGLAVAVLAAYGTDRLLAERPSRKVLGVAAGAVALGLLEVIVHGPSFQDVKLLWNHFRTGTDWPQVVSFTSIAWFLLLAAITLGAVLARRYVGATVAGILLLAALVLDLGHFSRDYNPMLASSFGEFRPSPLHDRALIATLPPDSQMQTGLRDARGHDPPQPRHRYFNLWKRAVPDQGLSQPIDIPSPDEFAETRLLQLLSVRQFDATGSTRDPDARPRAFVPETVTRVAGEQEALDAVFAPEFVPATDVVVEGEAPAGASGQVSFVRDDPQRVDLRAELDSPGMVVLTDQLDKGWNVKVDGRDADPLRVDSVLRGVAVPEGTHTVSWTYRAPGLRAGLLLSVLGLLLIAVLALVQRQPRTDAGPGADRTVEL
jgi:Bacterial membrane protein YfhO